jgi:hypothetical protein
VNGVAGAAKNPEKLYFQVAPLSPSVPLEVVRMIYPLKYAAAFRAVAMVLFALATGCTLDTDVSQPAALIRYAGDSQAAPPNTTLPTSLAVVVVNQNGERLKNITVNWSITSGGGSLSASSVLSDDSGQAAVDYTTATAPGTAVITAQVHGLQSITFTATTSAP